MSLFLYIEKIVRDLKTIFLLMHKKYNILIRVEDLIPDIVLCNLPSENRKLKCSA